MEMKLTDLLNAYTMAQHTVGNEDPALADDVRNYCLAQIRTIVGATAPVPSSPATLEDFIKNLYNTVDVGGSQDHNDHLGGVGEMEGIWINLGLTRREFHNIVGNIHDTVQRRDAVVAAMLRHIGA